MVFLAYATIVRNWENWALPRGIVVPGCVLFLVGHLVFHPSHSIPPSSVRAPTVSRVVLSSHERIARSGRILLPIGLRKGQGTTAKIVRVSLFYIFAREFWRIVKYWQPRVLINWWSAKARSWSFNFLRYVINIVKSRKTRYLMKWWNVFGKIWNWFLFISLCICQIHCKILAISGLDELNTTFSGRIRIYLCSFLTGCL